MNTTSQGNSAQNLTIPDPSTINHVVAEIKKASYAIEVCNRLAEALRAHSTDEIPLDGLIDELANGYVIGGLSAAIEMLSKSINADIESLGGAE